MKKMNLLLKKCKSLSRQLGRSSSYSSLRSKSTKEEINNIWGREQEDDEHCETIYVGSTRKRYVISSKYLNHPLLNALIEKRGNDADVVVVNCEVVLFDHLLWMLENADPKISSESLEELVQLYVF
ncbi:auxin-responsive protein SAUR78 [Senna tora]|uniref:Auxin-responsive protein SAUR78 n=1 Tax=Senna tora TaxID=362788 RepID=A0A834WZU4_9FABA|nr:auxin-responsive protein SAUR78 [Senna tora]